MCVPSINEILFRRKNKIIVDARLFNSDPSENKLKLISTLIKNIETGYGYILDVDIINELIYYPEEYIERFYNQLLDIIENNIPTKIYSPMYKNFPQQVMEMPETELYLNAIMHYIGDNIGCRILPIYEEKKRKPLFENTDVIVINKGTLEDYYTCINNLFNSSTSISDQDKEDIRFFIENTIHNSQIRELLPNQFNNKEVMIYVLSELIRLNINCNISNYLKTPTDILRLAIGMSNGDISLSEKPRFRNFKRKERRFFLDALNKLSNKNIDNEMAVHKSIWLRLGEKIHPGEYKKKYPKAFEYFDRLRNDKELKTVNGIIRSYIEFIKKSDDVDNFETILKQFAKRYPGYFARSLDEILSNIDDSLKDIVLYEFVNIIKDISTNVLIQMLTHFTYRDEDYRVFLPKGNITKAFVKENDLNPISKHFNEKIAEIIIKSLIKRFGQYESLGTVYIDEKLDNYTIPFSQRSASKSLKTISRGSRIPFDENKNLRFFIYWKDGHQRTDIDLSCVFLTEDFKYIDHTSYTNLRTDFSVHSGDITSAPSGAAEFIDIDIKKALEMNIRYCVTSVFSFTHQPYCDLPECSFGWMERENLKSGDIYELKTVKNIFDLSADTEIALPVIIDLYKREVIWCDFSMTKNIVNSLMHSPASIYGINPYGNNLESNITSVLSSCIAGIYMRKLTIYELLLMHVKARADHVYYTKDEDIEFDNEFSVENNTHTDLDTLMGNFLI